MTGSERIRLVSSRPGSGRKLNPASRYRLSISNASNRKIAVHVYDRERGCLMVTWRGEVARRLLDSIAREERDSARPPRLCDKHFVQQLTVIAAGIRMRLNQRESSNAHSAAMCLRLRELGIQLPEFHTRIASLLFERPGQHLSGEDMICLSQLRYPCIASESIASLLDDLVRWTVIQRIEVDDRNVFYDIDTRPHLHVFDPGTREIRDAPGSGVLQVAG